jgi:hypothetical protein
MRQPNTAGKAGRRLGAPLSRTDDRRGNYERVHSVRKYVIAATIAAGLAAPAAAQARTGRTLMACVNEDTISGNVFRSAPRRLCGPLRKQAVRWQRHGAPRLDPLVRLGQLGRSGARHLSRQHEVHRAKHRRRQPTTTLFERKPKLTPGRRSRPAGSAGSRAIRGLPRLIAATSGPAPR